MLQHVSSVCNKGIALIQVYNIIFSLASGIARGMSVCRQFSQSVTSVQHEIFQQQLDKVKDSQGPQYQLHDINLK